MKKLSIILLLALLIMNIQCGGGGDRTHSGTTPVSIKVAEIADGTASGANQLSGAVRTYDLASAVADGDGEGRQLSMCRITITGPGMADMVREVDIAGKSSIRETFNVPSGLNRSFLIQMFIENIDTVIVQAKSDGKNLEGKYMEILMEPTRQADYFEAPEFSGILSVSNAETRSVMLNWKPATDNITDQKRMQYLIYLTTQSKRDQNTNDIFKAYEMGKGTIREEDPLLKYYYVNDEQFISYEYVGAIPEDENTLSGAVSHRLKTGVPYFFMVRASDEWGFKEDNLVESEQIVVYMLDVAIVGSGRVITKPEGIDCGEKCSEDFLSKKEVTLTAIAEEGAAFNGWEGGGCIGADDCKLTLKNNESIIANFCESKTYYKDEDGDTYGAPNKAMQSCSEPDGYVINSADCDDTNADNNPGAAEQCDEIDNNCNGQVDEGVVTNTYYRDADNDGFGDSNNTAQACLQPSGHVTDNTDCDDTDAAMNPGAAEQCDEIDNNCNGQVDEDVTISTYYRDADSDTYGDSDMSVQSCLLPSGYVIDNTDCDDTKALINPGAAEECDEIDNNCDSQIDEGVLGTYYEDTDADGYGNPDANLQACSVCTALGCPTLDNTDCDDTNGAINPGAAEVCDEIDNNCNGEVDEGVNEITYYRDSDGDGYGDPNITAQACSRPSGYRTDNTDCDDTNEDINPGAAEVCDEIDNNCNGEVDEGVNENTYYRDSDGDGYGDPNITAQACSRPSGYRTDNTDCDDTNEDINPGAAEVCDEIDNNCNGEVDEGVNENTYYRDSDGDGYGDPNITAQACSRPSGYRTDNTDCDDTNEDINPGAAEVCDEIDNNCNGEVDEGVNENTYYRDSDGDGYGDPNITAQACSRPSGYRTDNTDCDDTNEDINPGSSEQCDEIDNNCNGEVDEGVNENTYFRDADNDQYGDPNKTTKACSRPSGYRTDNTDCDDTRVNVNPGEDEICDDDFDNDCDGKTNYDDSDCIDTEPPSFSGLQSAKLDCAASPVEIDLSWPAANDNVTPQKKIRYRICWDTEPLSYSSGKPDCHDVIGGTSYSIDSFYGKSLVQGILYYVGVTPQDEAGNWRKNDVVKKVTVDCSLPAPNQTYPPDGVVYDHYPRTTNLIWDAVSGAVSYTVEVDCFHCCQANQWCTDVGGMYKLEPNLKGTSFKFDFVGAQPGRWRVWAVDSNGRAGAKSQWRTFRYTQ